MLIELKVAIFATVVFVVLYFAIAIVALRSIIGLGGYNPFWATQTGCVTAMQTDPLSKKCLCSDKVNSDNCLPTGKTYKNNPSECDKCSNIKIPVTVTILQVVVLILFIITILFWVNVFTKTVKF